MTAHRRAREPSGAAKWMLQMDRHAGNKLIPSETRRYQQRKTAYGHRFTAHLVGNLRRNWMIRCFEPPASLPEGELVTIKGAAAALGIAASTIHRWLNAGFVAGE